MLGVHQSRHFYQSNVLLRQTFYTGYANFISEKAFQKFKLKQAKLRCEDGRPVFLKCGFRDQVLLWTNILFATYGTIKSLRTLGLE